MQRSGSDLVHLGGMAEGDAAYTSEPVSGEQFATRTFNRRTLTALGALVNSYCPVGLGVNRGT